MKRGQIALEAERVFGDRSAACDWLAERNPELDGKSPSEIAGDDPDRVLDLLARMQSDRQL